MSRPAQGAGRSGPWLSPPEGRRPTSPYNGPPFGTPTPVATNTLHALTPDALLERLADSGLRGRGGGWFEAARKWKAVRSEGGEPLVVANGAEGEPGSFKDRYVMRHRPADVVAGLVLAARAVGAREAVVFLKGSFDGPAASLAEALGRLRSTGPGRIHRGTTATSGGETAPRGPRGSAAAAAAAARRGRLCGRPTPSRTSRPSPGARPRLPGRPEERPAVTVWATCGRPGVREVPPAPRCGG
jgi:hypothetical protein